MAKVKKKKAATENEDTLVRLKKHLAAEHACLNNFSSAIERAQFKICLIQDAIEYLEGGYVGHVDDLSHNIICLLLDNY